MPLVDTHRGHSIFMDSRPCPDDPRRYSPQQISIVNLKNGATKSLSVPPERSFDSVTAATEAGVEYARKWIDHQLDCGGRIVPAEDVVRRTGSADEGGPAVGIGPASSPGTRGPCPILRWLPTSSRARSSSCLNESRWERR